MKTILSTFLFILFFADLNGQYVGGGQAFSSAICSDSTISSWGGGGALGDSINNTTPLPTTVYHFTHAVSIASGYGHSLAIKDDGTVWTWGSNQHGEMGIGSTGSSVGYPVQVLGLNNIIAVSAGIWYSMALRNDGTVWAWGYNNSGQLGDNSVIDRTSPVQVSGLSGIISIAAGGDFSLALKGDGTVWAWGANINGQLGNNSWIERHTPVQVHNLSNAIAIFVSGGSSYAKKIDGSIVAWGYNGYGKLADGTTSSQNVPVTTVIPMGIESIVGGAGHSIALKNDGTVYSWGRNGEGQLGLGDTINRMVPTLIIGLQHIIDIGSGNVHSLAVKNDGSVWSWGYNGYGQLGDSTYIQRLSPVQVQHLCYVGHSRHSVSGYLYNDSSGDCSLQLNEFRLASFPILITPGNYYSFSDLLGRFQVSVNDSVLYTLTPIIPQHLTTMLSNPCPSSHSIFINSNTALDSGGFDIGFEGTACWQLRIDVSADRKRRCFRSNTSISYWNEGLISVDSVIVHVKLDEFDIPVSATTPFTIDSSDGSLVFFIGTLQPNQAGSIVITDSIACVISILNLTQCTEAWILPANVCLLDSTTGSGWDHSSINVEGECVQDTCRFVIRNGGTGDMSVAGPYRIYADNILNYTGSFQLQAGDSLVVLWVSQGATIRLEADQSAGHPGNSRPRFTLEACGTNGSGSYSTGQVNLAPLDDEDIDREVECLQIVGSYDPNEKRVSPEGIGTSNIVLPHTPLNYTIHFQNTGTDTAYKVVVVDSLSNDLDLSTLVLGSSSHGYSASLSGQNVGVLKFTFENIFLPDSTTDELNSNGYVNFKITPLATLALGTQIDNAADIYFDYNDPIKTNNTFVTLGNYFVVGTDNPILSKDKVKLYPNPTTGLFTLEHDRDTSIQQVIVSGIDGKVVGRYNLENTGTYTIDLKALNPGIYFVKCVSKTGDKVLKVAKY